MGRPLYSRAFKTTPLVREPEQPTYEKWSYLNAFDPDSDEFFENENAVYEDFIGPVRPANNPLEDEDEEDVEERDMLVVRMGNTSPITSESSLSDSDSPLADDTQDPARLVVDDFRDLDQLEDGERTPTEPAVRVRLATRAARRVRVGWSPPRVHPQSVQLNQQPASPARSDIQRESLPVPPPSAPIPVPVRRSTAVDERAVAVAPSSTPPRQTAVTYVSMSPPPTSTPRLYTWSHTPGHSSSPSAGSPFTNPHARTSYAHLSPALVRIRDVTV